MSQENHILYAEVNKYDKSKQLNEQIINSVQLLCNQ